MDWDFIRIAWPILAIFLLIGIGFLYFLFRDVGFTGPERRRRMRATQAQLDAMFRPTDALPLEEIGRVPYASDPSFFGPLSSGRAALVRFPTFIEENAHPGANPSIEIAAPHAPRLSIRRPSLWDQLIVPRQALYLPGFVVVSPDRARTRDAFAASERLTAAIRVVFERGGIEHLTLWDGKLRARVKGFLPPPKLRALLHDLDMIVAVFEPVPIRVKVLGGGLRRALQGLAGSPRCSYCHADVTGDEPDLVACGLCHTILHEGCWAELGRCPVLGCAGKEPERGSERARA